MSEPRAAASQVISIAEQVESRFRGGRRVLSFAEFLGLFDAEPLRYSRDASRYLRDVFDLPWEPLPPSSEPKERSGAVAPAAKGGIERPLPRGALIGQEQVQEEIYRALSNFAREGRPNRLVLLHGPNGSAKSTIASCMMAGLEHYST